MDSKEQLNARKNYIESVKQSYNMGRQNIPYIKCTTLVYFNQCFASHEEFDHVRLGIVGELKLDEGTFVNIGSLTLSDGRRMVVKPKSKIIYEIKDNFLLKHGDRVEFNLQRHESGCWLLTATDSREKREIWLAYIVSTGMPEVENGSE